MADHPIFKMAFAKVDPMYLQKAEKKGREKQLDSQITQEKDFKTFFAEALKMNPNRKLIKGVVCGIRVEEVEDPLMREIRYLGKLIDELAKGKAMEKILRSE